MKDKSIDMYMRIVGFHVDISFHKPLYEIDRVEMIRVMKNVFRPFIVMDKPEKIDFSIHFIDRENFDLLIKSKTGCFFIKFFELRKNRRALTYYYVRPLFLIVIFRYMLLELLSDVGGFFLHSSSCLMKEKAMVFVGKSGIGKSTVIKEIAPYVSLSDDIVCIKKDGGSFVLYQTPFISKVKSIIPSIKPYTIGGIFFLHRSKTTTIVPLKTKKQIASNLFPQLYLEQEYIKNHMRHAKSFVEAGIPFFDFYINKPQEISHVLVDFIAHGNQTKN